jgi:hypothetical protein
MPDKGTAIGRQPDKHANFAAHYHAERNHQGIGNQLLLPGEGVGRRAGEIACRERLGGLLRYYYRLFRSRHRRYYSEFRTMPSKPSKAAGHKDFLFKHSA